MDVEDVSFRVLLEKDAYKEKGVSKMGCQQKRLLGGKGVSKLPSTGLETSSYYCFARILYTLGETVD